MNDQATPRDPEPRAVSGQRYWVDVYQGSHRWRVIPIDADGSDPDNVRSLWQSKSQAKAAERDALQHLRLHPRHEPRPCLVSDAAKIVPGRTE